MTDEGNCKYCGAFIANKDNRTLKSQGHGDGGCAAPWKKTRYLGSQGPSGSSPPKRARSSDENSGLH
jgi:hypothetical protein